MLKQCSRCHAEKEHKLRANGRSVSWCVDCTANYGKEYRRTRWARTKARDTWKGMIARCYDPKQGWGSPPGVPRYEEYGGRGVTVAKRWQGPKGFENFLSDVGLPPNRVATLDRKNPKRNYVPSNVRWTDPQTQQENKRRTHWIEAEYEGEEIRDTLFGWARRLGMKPDTLVKRFRRGWSVEDALNTEVGHPREVPF